MFYSFVQITRFEEAEFFTAICLKEREITKPFALAVIYVIIDRISPKYMPDI